MQCANCGFYNMPGATACGRCSTSLGLATAVLDVHPPRASARAKRLRRVLPVRRMVNHVRSTLPAGRHEAAFSRALPSMPAFPLVWRSVVPGWPHFYLHQRLRGHLFLWGWALCLLISVVLLGSTWGGVWFGLAFSVHASAISDLATQNVADLGLRDRMARGLAVSAVVWIVIYWPLMVGVSRVAQPHTVAIDMPPFSAGDVIIVNHAARARVGQVVLFHTPDVIIDGGRVGNEHLRYQYTGEAVDRILAGPGDHVSYANGQFRVNGKPSRWLPLNAMHMTKPADFIVPPLHFLILPSGAPAIESRLDAEPRAWQSLASIDESAVEGSVLFRSNPLSRFHVF